MQRYTGLIAFVFIGWHVYTERFLPHGNSTFASVQQNLAHPLYFWFYVIGVTAASVHLGTGVWNFRASGESRRPFARSRPRAISEFWSRSCSLS